MGKAIGIDFGTTNTIVSYKNSKGKVVSYRDETTDKEIIPSAIYFFNEDDWIIGEEAKENIVINPRGGILNFKSKLGTKDFQYRIISEEGDEFSISPKKVASYFLMTLLRKVQRSFEEEFEGEDCFIDNAVVAVPAKFNHIEKAAIKEAVSTTGISEKKIGIVTESTAAAFAHISLLETDEKPQTVLVYDFGGGTFDVSLLKIQNNGVYREAVTPEGDKKLGGNKLTKKIIEEIVEILSNEYDIEIPLLEEDEKFNELKYGMTEEEYSHIISNIFNEADIVKTLASRQQNKTCNYYVDIGDKKNCKFSFDRNKVESIIQDDIEKTVNITQQVVEAGKKEGIDKPDSVVIAGGSSQILMVKEKLENALGMEIKRADNISTIISRGAALFAEDMENGNLQPISRTNTQLGIKSKMGNILDAFKPIIDINQEYPCSATETFRLNEDDIRSLSIEIFERDINNEPVHKRNKIARVSRSESISWIDELIISNLPEGLKKDKVTIDITLSMTSDGLLNVKALIRNNDGSVIDNSDMTITYDGNLR